MNLQSASGRMIQEEEMVKGIKFQLLTASQMTADVEKASGNGTISRKKKTGATDILDLVGGDGPWQRRIFLVIIYIGIPLATHNLAMAFLAPNLDHWCAKPSSGTGNLSLEQWRRVGLPPDDMRCSRYEYVNFTLPVSEMVNASSESNIVPCDAWDYDDTFYTSTVLSQWDLVCERQWLVSMSKSVFMVGNLFAVTVFAHLADRLGRRPVLTATAFIAVFSATICAFSTSFAMFIVARFFVALGIAGCYNTAFVLLMEVVGPELRSVYGMAVNFGWCLGFVSLPAIAWLLRDWFWIQIALTAPCIVLLGIWWMLPESPRWLLSRGKIEEAQKILCRAARVNGRKLSDVDTTLKKVMTKATETQQSGESKTSVINLLTTPGLWQITLNVYFIWFVTAFVYYGLSYNTNELAGNPFINFALSGAVEFPAYLFSLFAIRSLGRRNPLAGSMVLGGLACLLSYPLPQNPWWLTVTVTNIGKFCISCAFGIIYVFTAELFPTVVRNTGLGSASLCARLGSILAPFIRELGSATHPVVPQITFGILAAISGALVLFLPETNNCTLPDTFNEAAQASRRGCKKPKKLSNGNHVVITLSNGDAAAQDDLSSQTVFAPSPKQPEKNGLKKLADVPEEDSHCGEDTDTELASAVDHQTNQTTPPAEETNVPADAEAKTDDATDEVTSQDTESRQNDLNAAIEAPPAVDDSNNELVVGIENDDEEQRSEL